MAPSSRMRARIAACWVSVSWMSVISVTPGARLDVAWPYRRATAVTEPRRWGKMYTVTGSVPGGVSPRETMTTRVLVAYATKMGSTREIAEVIAEVLAAAGLEADAPRRPGTCRTWASTTP